MRIALEIHDPVNLVFKAPEGVTVKDIQDNGVDLSPAPGGDFAPKPGYYQVNGRFVKLGAVPYAEITAAIV